LLQKTKIKPVDLSAIALSAGPGSYTGLRIGTSAAKGLCYALKIPLIGISTLLALCEAAKEKHNKANYYIPALDARRMEIYTAVYTNSGEEILKPHARIMDQQTASELFNYSNACIFGDGMPKCLSLIEKMDGLTVLDKINPSAKYMHAISYQKFLKNQFENVAYFEPFYLKEYMFAQKQK
jgi:tRNA threonylcarbamoyladenosine biosynthesis protein TsaB